MTAKILPPKVAEFVSKHWQSADARRMFFVGQVLVKVAGMFQLLPDEDVPEQVTLAFILLLEGMESGNAAEYARCEASAHALWHEWLASREVH